MSPYDMNYDMTRNWKKPSKYQLSRVIDVNLSATNHKSADVFNFRRKFLVHYNLGLILLLTIFYERPKIVLFMNEPSGIMISRISDFSEIAIDKQA